MRRNFKKPVPLCTGASVHYSALLMTPT